MNQKTKTIIGVGVVAIVGYLIWKNQQSKTETTSSFVGKRNLVSQLDESDQKRRPPRLIRPNGDTIFLPTAPNPDENPRPRPRPRPRPQG